MGNIKKSQYQGLRKYNRIVSYLVKDKKKRGVEYNLAEIRKLASSIYPNFKTTNYSRIGKRAVVSAEPFKKIIVLTPSEKQPTFPSALSDPDERYYWGIYDMLQQIQNETLKDDNLFFTSDIAGLENLNFQGGVKLEPDFDKFYQATFKNLVNFFDKQRKAEKIDLGSGSNLRVLCTKPEKKGDKWISKIVFSDAEGNQNLPDEVNDVIKEYDPAIKYAGFTKPKEPAKQQPAPTKLSATEQIEIEKIKAQERFAIEKIKSEERIAIEKEKTSQLRAEKMAELWKLAVKGEKNGGISWDRYDKLVDDLFR
jgi:hypothetical protein